MKNILIICQPSSVITAVKGPAPIFWNINPLRNSLIDLIPRVRGFTPKTDNACVEDNSRHFVLGDMEVLSQITITARLVLEF